MILGLGSLEYPEPHSFSISQRVPKLRSLRAFVSCRFLKLFRGPLVFGKEPPLKGQ